MCILSKTLRLRNVQAVGECLRFFFRWLGRFFGDNGSKVDSFVRLFVCFFGNRTQLFGFPPLLGGCDAMQCNASVADEAMKGGGPKQRFAFHHGLYRWESWVVDRPTATAAVAVAADTFGCMVQYLSCELSKAKRLCREFMFLDGKKVAVETIEVLPPEEGTKEQ